MPRPSRSPMRTRASRSTRSVSLPASPSSHLEPGSFRDWDSRVFYDDGRVLRALSEDGLADWQALSESKLFAAAVAEGKLVPTQAAKTAIDGAAAVLEHERIPFVSYPYEWTFAMLRDAALLQLELLRRALDEDLILKDSSSYNVQWRGAEPVFIDVGWFERLGLGEHWAGYREFFMLFLNPLLLQAFRAVGFRPWLGGSVAGITPVEAGRVLSMRDVV